MNVLNLTPEEIALLKQTVHRRIVELGADYATPHGSQERRELLMLVIKLGE